MNNLPVTLCWHCDRALDDASEIGGSAKPTPGAISLCLYCGALAIFTHELALRPATTEELDELQEDREFLVKYAQFSWARQYVMIKDSLMRDREDPDR